MLACVDTVRHAITKIEVEALDEFVLEVMSLNHPEVTDRLLPYCKLNPGRRSS